MITRETFHGLWRKYRLKLSNQIEIDIVVDAQSPIGREKRFLLLYLPHIY